MKKLFKERKALFALTIIMNVLFATVSVGMARILELILDAVTTQNRELFQRMILVVPVYIIISGVILIVTVVCGNKLVTGVVKDLRNKLYRGVISRDPENFHKINTGDYLSALTNDVKILEENGIAPFLDLVLYLLIFVLTTAMLIYYSPLITVLLFLCMMVMYLVPTLMGKKISERQGHLSNTFVAFTTRLKDQLAGYDVLRAYRLSERAGSSFEQDNREVAEAKFAADRLEAVSQGIAQSLAASIQLLTMLVSGYLVLQGQMTAGVLLAMLQLSGSFVQPVALIMQNAAKIKGCEEILGRLKELEENPPSVFNGSEAVEFSEKIEFSNVSFGYREDQNVLDGVNLSFEKNKKYAIIGPSGCGKTTLIKLLAANYGGYDGQILIDGKEIRTVDLDSLLAQVSVIHQNVYMFDESIADNICLHRNYPQPEWERALAVSGVGSFLEQMEAGLDTPVGEDGLQLSGGQRQRVAVARAVIEEKPILILDEGTSAVDRQTAYEIESALLDVPELTMLTITHNLNPELLQKYDQVLYIDNGGIAAAGDYQTLAETNERFCQYINPKKEVALT